jgi:hypothetical protein
VPTPGRLYDGIFGVQVYEADLEPIASGQLNIANVTWARARALWAAIEPDDTTPRTRRWVMTDSVLALLAERGIRPIVVAYEHPEWAAGTPCGRVDRVPLARYAEFVTALVERYDGDGVEDAPGSPRVEYWEILNEPDFDRSALAAHPEFGDPAYGYGGCLGSDPLGYAELLRAAYLAAKAADPRAKVVFGAVAYDRFIDHTAFQPRGPFRYNFTRDVLINLHRAHGTEPDWPFFDAFAFHSYNDYRNNWDGPAGRDPELVGKVKHLRANQLVVPGVYDLSSIPLISTEVGLPSAPSDTFTLRSETYQAAYAGQAMMRALAANLHIAVWFTTQDFATGECANPWKWLAYGLLRSKWVADEAAKCTVSPLPGYGVERSYEAKSALTAFATLARLFGGVRYDRQLTVAETGSVEVEAHRVILPNGRAALVAFTDHGERLGKRNQPDPQRDLVVGADVLPGWTGRVSIVDYQGHTRLESGARVTVPLTFAPTYILVEP